MTLHAPEYIQFRDNLDNHYLLSLKLKLMEMTAQL